ncbi:hypothetical protein NONO_c01350 [Nocardia nova SH22a]|uniref:Transmembrane protein n=1 Tax=Nocardia nova SH22a TaxID=1415166 RepID=W5T6M2_9NOCA|nr:hypothetical protein [Nocardia nova]AHH14955.1 hypothetical protein NONO_c01350 [Nocardia nova SH22a]
MSYPYGQPEYPGYGYPPAGYPPPGYAPGYAPYGYPEPRPSGGAAITAGVFSLLIALLAGFGVLALISAANNLNDEYSYSHSYGSSSNSGDIFFAIAAADGLIALLWAIGGIMLMNHKNAGRIIVVILSSLGLLGGIAGMITAFANGVPAASIGGIVGLAFAVLMLSLTLSGSAKRWCGVGMPAYPPAAYYGQPPYPY